MVIDQRSRQVLCTAHGTGRVHDFKLFKRSRVSFGAGTECLGDRGYQGLQKLHARSRTPQRKPPQRELDQVAKERNRELASLRIVVEHVIGKLKVFKILGERYRSLRRRFGLRVNLIAGIYNAQLNLK